MPPDPLVTDFVTSRFRDAYDALAREEGGWANNKNDKGGETAFGVARNFWPDWQGWVVVDAVKKRIGFPSCGVKALNAALRADRAFPGMLRDFFYDHFWLPVKGDKFTYAPLASEVFELAVNSGIGTSAKILQEAVNACGRPIARDGNIGRITLAAANAIRPDRLLVAFRQCAAAHYRSIVEHDPSQSANLNSWLNRLKGAKE